MSRLKVQLRFFLGRYGDMIVLMLFGALLSLLYAPFSYDEAYITFRYAANVARGVGFVFNPGERYLGTTGPGWALVLAGLHRLFPWLSIAQWSSVATGLLLPGVGLATYCLVRSLRAGSWSPLPAVLVMASPLLTAPMGGEVVPEVFLITTAWWRLMDGASWSWGVLAGLATWMRGDAVIALPILAGAELLWSRKFPWRGVVGYGTVLLPWFIFSEWFFGHPWPGTFVAKTAQCQSGLWICFGPGMVRWVGRGFIYRTTQLLRGLHVESWSPVLVGFVGLLIGVGSLIGTFRQAKREPRWWPILLWPLLHGLAYVIIRAPFYPWYATVVGWGGTLLISLGIIGLMQGNRFGRLIAFVLLFVIVLGYGLWHFQHYTEDVPDHRQPVHLRLATWFQDHTTVGSSIMGEEIGFLGYYLLNYRVYDTWGLITPGMGPHLLEHDLDWGVREYCPDHFLAYPERPSGFRVIPTEPWFRSTYVPVDRLEDTGLDYAPTITIYRARHPCPQESTAE